MNQIIKILALMIGILSYSQQIIDLEHQGAYRHYPQGAYFKDINHYLDPFVGTYIYSNSNINLKIVLIKRINEQSNLYIEDVIFGGYEYKVNGVSIVNTLPDNYPNNTFSSKYYLYGNAFLRNNSYPPCNSCAPNEKRLYITLRDPQCPYYRNIIIQRITENGIQKIKVSINLANTVYKLHTDPDPVFNFGLPSGDYILTKQ